MSLITQAKEILAQRKQQAELDAYINYQKALGIAEFKVCRQKIDTLLPKLAKAEACGEKDAETECGYKAALAESEKILKSAGMEEKDFTPKRFCAKCNDSGYINGEMCLCLKQIVNEIISDQYGIDFDTLCRHTDGKVYRNPDFERQLKDKYEMLKKYIGHFPQTKYSNHIFWGSAGTGKTYLACYVAKSIMQKGSSVIFVSAFKLNDIFSKYHFDYNGEYDDYIENLYDCDLLVIDDLGTENIIKNVTCEYFLSLISERITNNKHTLITTNLGAEHLRARYDDRFYSRLTDKNKTYTIFFDGADLRQVK